MQSEGCSFVHVAQTYSNESEEELMRVLVVHNRYQQSGGEDNVVSTETELLKANGHDVKLLQVDNDHIQGPWSKISASLGSLYSIQSSRLLEKDLGGFRPDIVHVHNFFPTISPSVFRACSHRRVPVVHTLHNFRIICAAATLFRDGHVCEECIERRSFFPAVQHACYRGSRTGSAISGLTMTFHDYLNTWRDCIDAYIVLTEFTGDKLGTYRIPRSKIHVKANSCPDFGVGDGRGDFALFVGRLTEEKGIRTLIEADLKGSLCMDIVVLGDGPLRAELETAACKPSSRLKLKGFLKREMIYQHMRDARVLIMPSLWYEAGIPLVVMEAFSMGLPVIAADTPNTRSVIHSGLGILFAAGNAEGLARALKDFRERSSVAKMRNAARREYLNRYTPERNYQSLLEIYERVKISSKSPSSIGNERSASLPPY
jgi:glycosyltransferase involved in cell wall biosynthesis